MARKIATTQGARLLMASLVTTLVLATCAWQLVSSSPKTAPPPAATAFVTP